MTADMYDDAYASFASSPIARHLFGPVLDSALPAGLEPYSFVTSELLEYARMTLNEVPVRRLVDLGCGRGGPGLWLAQELGCDLFGIDRSLVAVVNASSRRDLYSPTRGLRHFIRAEMSALPFLSASVDAVVCFDALQTSEASNLILREASRVLRPGGRFVATTWQAVDLNDDRVQPRLRVDLRRLTGEAGLELHSITTMNGAHEAEMNVARAALAISPRLVERDLIVQRVVGEAAETLAQAGLTRRIVLTADGPGRRM